MTVQPASWSSVLALRNRARSWPDPSDTGGAKGLSEHLGGDLAAERLEQRIDGADSREALVTARSARRRPGPQYRTGSASLSACKVLDRVMRSGRYWIPHWYKSPHWLAYWDVFGKPAEKPRYARGIPETWWYDREKAAKIERAG
jgi:hypothetical protein